MPVTQINLEATVESSSSVQLTWTPLSKAKVFGKRVDNYDVIRNGAVITTTSSSVNTYTDTGLNASTTYGYLVEGIRKGKVIGESTTISVTTSAEQVGCGIPNSDANQQNYAGAVVVTEMQQNTGNTVDVNVPVDVWATPLQSAQYPKNIVLLNASNQIVTAVNSQPGSPVQFNPVSTTSAGCRSNQDDNAPYAVVLGYGTTSVCLTNCNGYNDNSPWALANGVLEGQAMVYRYTAAGTPKGAVTGGQWVTSLDSSGNYSYPAVGTPGLVGNDYIVLTYIEPAS